MALRCKVKAGRLTNLTDARFFNAQGADWLGFSMDVLDPMAVSLKDAAEIRNWLFEPRIVIECGHHQDRTEMIHLANELRAEAIQTDTGHPVLQEEHFLYPLLLTVPVADLQSVSLRRILSRQSAVEGLIIRFPDQLDWADFRTRTSGTKRAIARWKRDYDVLIDLPFEPGWIEEALELLEPTGIHLTGDMEEKPGISRVDEYAALLEKLEIEEE